MCKHQDLFDTDDMYCEPVPALFGDGPKNTHWQMAHGAGGGYASVGGWYGDELWGRAAHE
jgi:hypothetical protein